MEKITSLEENIISYLALHPRRNIQQIQRGLGIQDKNYPTVRNAMPRLEKKGFVEFTQGKSEKKVVIRFYRLTAKGRGYALAYGNSQVTLQVPSTYENEEPQLAIFTQISTYLSTSTLLKLLRIVGKGILQYGKDYLPNQAIAALAIEGAHLLTEKEYGELKRACAKIPEIKARIEKAIRTLSNFSLEE